MNASRYIQIRGDAELVFDGALDHIDGVRRKYTRPPAFYGYVYPVAAGAGDAGHLPDPRPPDHP